MARRELDVRDLGSDSRRHIHPGYWSYDPAFLHYPNEHIIQQGKFLVAQRLADRILEGD